MSDFARDYVEVAERIDEFYKRFPEGRLQAELVSLTDTLVVMRGLAYRTPDDPLPGTGHSTLTIPGKTPYTRDAEVENTETSAIGRAIVMVGIPSKKVASADEVRAKAAPQKPPVPPRPEAPAGGSPTAPAPGTLDLEDDAQWAAIMASVKVDDRAAPEPSGQPDEPYRHHGPRCPTHDREWKDTARGPKCTKNDGTREEPVWCKWQPSRKWLAAQEVAR